MSYKHFTISERGKPKGFLALKMRIREIVKIMGRHYSTIAGKIKRNSNDFYHATTADEAARQEKTKVSMRSKLSAELIEIIEDKLNKTWSPEQISNTFYEVLFALNTFIAGFMREKLIVII